MDMRVWAADVHARANARRRTSSKAAPLPPEKIKKETKKYDDFL